MELIQIELKGKTYKEREIPHSHLYQTLLPVIFACIWILDSRILKLSIFLNEIIPSIVRAVLFAAFLSIAIILMALSHRTLFNNGPPTTLITGGIFSHTRNPMYLGVLFIYIAFMALSISLISVGFFMLIIYAYTKMVDYEEKVLEEIFNKDYKEYRGRVPKWIPHLRF